MVFKLHKAQERGKSELGWLSSRFSFSFSNYFNPQRMGFGTLRVVNDDVIKEGQGFGTHPHADMEIITIVTKGAVAHKDSMGSDYIVSEGEVQVMSAGTGVFHSEFNANQDKDLELFQIWIQPHTKGVEPRYDQRKIDLEKTKNGLFKVVSGDKSEDTLYIYQDASISLGKFTEEKEIRLDIKEGKGLFLMVVEGEVQIEEYNLKRRDSLEISGVEQTLLKTQPGTELLLIEVSLEPTNFA